MEADDLLCSRNARSGRSSAPTPEEIRERFERESVAVTIDWNTGISWMALFIGFTTQHGQNTTA